MTNYRKYRNSYRSKKDRKKAPISWSEYNINCFDDKIDAANKITDNASKQCSNLKIFFITFCMPVTAAWFALYFSCGIYNSQTEAKIVSGIIFVFYVLITFIVFFLHREFYKRQAQYRKVIESLETLKEKFILELNDNSILMTVDKLNGYYNSIRQISSMSVKIKFWKQVKDLLFCLIPLGLLILFWIIVFACNHFGYLLI